MSINTITATFGGMRKTMTLPVNYQYDISQVLEIRGIELPSYFEVDFCNEGDVDTITMIGSSGAVQIPDQFLATGRKVKAYIVLTEDDSTQTRYEITIPVIERPARTETEPTPVEQDLIDQLIAALAAGVAAAEAAAAQIERMSAEASTLPAGSSATAAWDAEHGKLLLGIPKGDTGADGAEGPEGPEGPAGSDGYSPTVTVEAITGGHRVTITDAEGDHVFDVMDGQGGGGSSVDPYDSNPAALGTAAPGSSDKYARGDHVHPKPTPADIGAGTYSKPAGGIPKTDLASGVQSSLDKADAALPKAGGTMIGAIAMGGSRITGLGAGVNDGDAATKKQLDDAIAGLGTVFTIKGDVAAVADLPASGNTVGDVYYVRAVSAAFVWLETTEHPTGYWEEFGEPIDLSGYIAKPSGATVNQYLVFNGTAWAASNLPAIPSTAADVGAIAAPSSPATGAFLVWNGSAWVAQTLATWQGGNY